MIYKDEEWVSICKLDKDDEIRFTKGYLDLTKDIGWERRRFASHLISHWVPEFRGMLDYFGSDEEEKDHYTGIDTDPMDIREDICELWETYGMPFNGLEAEWYRDIMRAKLVSLKLPKRLISKYIEVLTKQRS